MKLFIAGLLAASTLSIAAPAVAQGIYIGPRAGVGVGVGPRHYDDGFYRDGYADDDGVYEGRSAYRDRYIEDDDF